MELSRKGERGVALLFSLFALFLLTAIAFGLIYMTNTETSINSNFRNDQALYFAARAGIEEARNRMMLSNPNSLFNCAGGANTCLPTPAQQPGVGSNYQVLYLLGGAAPGAVDWANSGSPYFDNELCHDGYTGIAGIYPQSSDVPCQGSLPGGSWFGSTTSLAPFAATNAALPYQWVRVAPKVNNSVQQYPVNGNALANGLVCYDGQEEIMLTPGLGDCSQMPALNPPGAAATQVYMVTSLAVNTVSSARRLEQAEIALPPAPPFPYGLFATGTGCGAVSMGGGATTDSYSTANGGNYNNTKSATLGDVGSNGNVSASGNQTKIGGSIGVPVPTQGACPGNGFTTQGGAGMVTGTNPPNQLQQIQPYVFPTPPMPNPLPPDVSYPPNGQTMPNPLPPGTYGNITVSSGQTLTLMAGTYNINSVTLNGNANVVVSGAVVINVAGTGSAANNPIDLTGNGQANCPGPGNNSGSICNSTAIPNNLQINYGGSGTVKINGGSESALIVNAPNAPIVVNGNADVFGALIGNTITATGGMQFHYDKNTKFGPPNLGSYTELAFRELMY